MRMMRATTTRLMGLIGNDGTTSDLDIMIVIVILEVVVVILTYSSCN